MKSKPKKCCYPNCFDCPYADCRYDRLEYDDFKETNQRDYEMHKAYTGEFLHREKDSTYRNKASSALQRRKRETGKVKSVTRTEYNKMYYELHREEILEKSKLNYKTKKNTIRCRKWRKKNKEKKSSYDKERYENNKERIKERARQRYHNKKMSQGNVMQKCERVG